MKMRRGGAVTLTPERMAALPTSVREERKMKTHRGQRQTILLRLQRAMGDWVSLRDLWGIAAQYNARIFELRREGYDIQNRTEIRNGQRHSRYRLVQC